MSDLWIFGYGSLMWRPGFAFLEARMALLDGYHRAFCIYSVHHRGTAARPGLVLGLDKGGQCLGVAYRIAPDATGATLLYLRAREQVTGVYREDHRTVVLRDDVMPESRRAAHHDGGQRTSARVFACCYVVERAHPQYSGRLALTRQADIIRSAHGMSGANAAYLGSTVDHLLQLDVRDRELERLRALVGVRSTRGREPAGTTATARLRPFEPRHAAGLQRPRTFTVKSQQNRFVFRRNLGQLGRV